MSLIGLCRIAILLVTLAGGAAASPWQREEGGKFLSFSGDRDRAGNSYTGLYGEYGLSDRRMVVFELGYSNVGETDAMLSLQRALDDGDGPNRWVFSLGAGLVARDNELIPTAQFGLGWGRGFERILGGGWLSAEARVKVAATMDDDAFEEGLPESSLDYITPETMTKAELTLGLRPMDGMLFINQIWLEERPDTGFSAKLASSIVQDITGPVKLEIGAILPISGVGDQALKIGTWLEF